MSNPQMNYNTNGMEYTYVDAVTGKPITRRTPPPLVPMSSIPPVATDDAMRAAYFKLRVAELEAELARLRPLAELYPLAWEECEAWRKNVGDRDPAWFAKDTNQSMCAADAHDKARAERGVA